MSRAAVHVASPVASHLPLPAGRLFIVWNFYHFDIFEFGNFEISLLILLAGTTLMQLGADR